MVKVHLKFINSTPVSLSAPHMIAIKMAIKCLEQTDYIHCLTHILCNGVSDNTRLTRSEYSRDPLLSEYVPRPTVDA